MVLSERITHFYTDPCPIKPTVRIRKLIINVLWAFLTLNQYILLRIWMLKLYTCITMWLLWTFILHGLNISSINEVKKFSLRTLQELSKTAYFTCTHYFIQKWTFCIKLSIWIFNGNFQLCECTQTLLSGQIYSIILKGCSSKKNVEPNHLKTSLKHDFVRW